MTRPLADVQEVAALLDQGVSQAEAARRTGIPRSTLRYWVQRGSGTARSHAALPPCDPCPYIESLPGPAYAYLLGLYLGDGCISAHEPGVYRLRIVLDLRYPDLIRECRVAMARVLPNKVGDVPKIGCIELSSYSKHWPCLFPQHGPGRKHLRIIALTPWQETIALDTYPKLLLRGLIHSDGWRGTNRVRGGRYEYPRYQFVNHSTGIRDIFREACQRVGVACRPMGPFSLAVSRRADVARMDLFIGPKH